MNIAVAQSGGPTCAINASLLGVVKQALQREEIGTVYGSRNGIEGILKDRLVDMGELVDTEEKQLLLRRTPATALGSCRFKLPAPEADEAPYQQIVATFQKHDIGAFFYIGGNDSMDTVDKLSAYFAKTGKDIRVIGVPKTIDNDLAITDHTPGFGSAAKYLAVTMQEIIRDSMVYDLPSVLIAEVMGRHAGWLTASTCLLRANGETAPHRIYLPESPFSVARFLEDIKEANEKHQAVIVAVSEGVNIPQDEQEGAYRSGQNDAFGHQYLSGIGKYLEQQVSRKLGLKVRSVELNVLQRCSSHLASKTDLDEAEQIGAAAVTAALKGTTGVMMAFRRVRNTPYEVEITTAPASEVANAEKVFPAEWISPAGNDVSADAIPYFLPLIQGEEPLTMKNGMPVHFKL